MKKEKKKAEAKGPSPQDVLALEDALKTERGKKKNTTTVPMATSYNPVAVEARGTTGGRRRSISKP